MPIIKDIFKDFGFQFTSRYVYDSGEVSALSPFSKMVKARESLDLTNTHITGISKLILDISGITHPTYSKYLEIYARKNNTGTLFRVTTINLDSAFSTSISFTGESFEALDSTESAKLFDSVPLETKAIEVSNNRIFLGNNKDSFDADTTGNGLKITYNGAASTAQTLTDSSDAANPISYLRYSSDVAERVTGFGNNPYANSSLYKIGYAFYDEYFRTRGVEDYIDFETGNFTYPIYPDFTLKRDDTLGSIPTWAKYYQIVMTKNLSKDFSLEGYASNYYWILNDTAATRIKTLSDSKKGEVKYFVIDLSGMIRSGYTYTYQEGDRININFDTTATANEASNTKIIRNLKVIGQADNLLYIEFSAKDGFTVDAWDSANKTEVYRLFFEVYSPKAETDTTIFFECGTLRTVATDFANNNNTVTFDISANTIEGDMMFQNIEVKGYSNSTTVNATAEALPTDDSLDQAYKVLIRKIDGTKAGAVWSTNAGKPLIVYDGKQTNRNKSKIRYSGKYIQGTSINPISSFDAFSQEEVPYENGEITSLVRTSKLQNEGSVMLAICERETASLYIGEQVFNDTTGSQIVSVSDKVIGTVRNLKGGFGCVHKKSVFSYGGNVYWWDNNKKKVLKYGVNGLLPISDIGMSSHFLDKSGDAVGFFDPFLDIYHIRFTSETVSVGFSNKRNRWVSFYDLDPVEGNYRADKMILFKGTSAYESLNTTFLSLLGTSRTASIKYVMNTQLPEVPKNIKIYSNMTVADYSQDNDVKATLLDVDLTNENGQATDIVESNFLHEDTVLFAHVLRDKNSTGGLIEGEYMVGQLHELLLNLKDTSQEMRINNILVDTDVSAGHIS